MGTYEIFGRYLDRCESPIEARFLHALLFSDSFSFRPVSGRGWEIAENADGIILGQQVPVGGFRADFALKRARAARRVAIEIDGRTFHSSPEQVERDKLRDRTLLALGWTTVRYAGREIVQDAVGCARQALEIAMKVSVPAALPVPLARTTASGQLPLAAKARTA